MLVPFVNTLGDVRADVDAANGNDMKAIAIPVRIPVRILAYILACISAYISACISARIPVRAALAVLAWSLLAAAPASAQAVDPWPYVANDRAPGLKDLLAHGLDPNVRYQGQPALMQAVRDGAWRVFDVLAADPRTDVNAANPSDETPLMYLAVQGQTERARTLIARGAQVNRLGWTPLHYAASKGHVDTAKLLLSRQAIVNAPGPDGTTPLMMAAFSGSEDMVQLLLNAGADVSMHNLQGLDAAAWARSAHYEQLARQLDEAAARHQRGVAARHGGSGDENAQAPALAPATSNPGGGQPSPPNAPQPPRAPQGAGGQGAGMQGDGGTDVQGVSGLRLDPDGAPSTP